LNSLSSSLNDFLGEIGGTFLFLKRLLLATFRSRGFLSPILGQMLFVFGRSLSTVAFAGVFVGAILVLQFNLMLAKFDAQAFLGGLNTSAVVRQVGPLIISFLLAGKIGAFTAAELGTMRVTEQIDAIECLGADPLQYLLIPRFFGIVLAGVMLLVLGLMISILGSMAVSTLFCGVNFLQYLESVPRFIDPWVLTGSFVQAFIYSTIVALVSCYKGFTTSGGARGVGRAVTSAAVFTNLYIVVANFLTSEFWDYFTRLAQSLIHVVENTPWKG
jgi:phospholipid/cholesterol/gamma-HCH transport system permease protein